MEGKSARRDQQARNCKCLNCFQASARQHESKVCFDRASNRLEFANRKAAPKRVTCLPRRWERAGRMRRWQERAPCTYRCREADVSARSTWGFVHDVDPSRASLSDEDFERERSNRVPARRAARRSLRRSLTQRNSESVAATFRNMAIPSRPAFAGA